MRWACVTPVKIVGANQKPLLERSHCGLHLSAPSASPIAESSLIFMSCSFELIAPRSVFLSRGSPTRIFAIRTLSFSIISSAILSCTIRREPAQQTWPWLKKIPLTMPSTVSSTGASSKTIFAPLPPSSRVAFLSVEAIARAIFLPTSVEPVNAILCIPGWLTIALPVEPSPVTILTTPSGSSACWQTSAKRSAVRDVVSAGLRTTVLPVASAGATFHASISSGKFHGMICPATP